MANQFRDIDKEKLIELAQQFVDECMEMTKEVPTAKGVQRIRERNLPTVKFFAMQWLKKQGFDFYARQYFYEALANDEHPLSDTFKKIRYMFDCVAEDVVANEGKGIFYAKNRLGMTDKVDTKNDTTYRLIDDTDSPNKTTETTQSAGTSTQ